MWLSHPGLYKAGSLNLGPLDPDMPCMKPYGEALRLNEEGRFPAIHIWIMGMWMELSWNLQISLVGVKYD